MSNILDEFSPATGSGRSIRINDNTGRAKVIIIVLWISFGLSILSALSNFMQYMLLGDFAMGNVDEQAAQSNDIRQGLIGIGQLILLIVGAVTFIMWFRRAYNNLHSVKAQGLSFTEVWAAGAWFVPFLNLVRPYTIMKEIWEVTQQYTIGKSLKESTSLIGLWWGFWIGSNILANISFRLQLRADSIDALSLLTLLDIVCDLVEIVSAWLAISLVKKVSTLETAFRQSYQVN